MIYVFLAEGFEETEAITPIDMLRRCGKEVLTVGVTGKVVRGAHNIPVECDITIDEAGVGGLEMIVLPGGMPGTKNLAASKKLAQMIAYCTNNKIFMGAICAAPSVLGSIGVLNGKKAVCYPGFESKCTGAHMVDADVVTDGPITTGRALGAAIPFALELVRLLTDEQAAARTAEEIVWRHDG